ncbi:MAG: hypothetical protein AB7S38_07750 [Vulcanimicrobiota bacterium]
MSDYLLPDTCYPAFAPLIDLSENECANITARAVTAWLGQSRPDAWGASMFLFGPTRRMLFEAGLCLEWENWQDLFTQDERWHELLGEYQAGSLATDRRLYLARLLMHVGLYQGVFDVLHDLEGSEEELGWARYFRFQSRLMEDWHCPLGDFGDGWLPAFSPRLRYEVGLLLATTAVREREPAEVERWLAWVEATLPEFDEGPERSLARARWLKKRTGLDSLRGQPVEEGYRAALACLESIEDPNWLDLAVETERRTRGNLTSLYLRREDYASAEPECLRVNQLDPFCSMGWMLRGRVAEGRGHLDQAGAAYTLAARYGPLERTYSLHRLAELTGKEQAMLVMESIEADFADALETVVAARRLADGTRLSAWFESVLPDQAEEAETPPFPLYVSTMRALDRDSVFLGRVRRGETYQRFLPYWELQAPTLPHSLSALMPLQVYQGLTGAKPPGQVGSLQRALGADFRDELRTACYFGTERAQSDEALGREPESLRGLAPPMDHFLDLLEGFDDQSLEQKNQLCRLLAALGFYGEAIRLLPMPDPECDWGLHDCNAFLLRQNYRHVLVAEQARQGRDFDYVFAKTSGDPEFLRLRYGIALAATIHHGLQREGEATWKWREIAQNELARLAAESSHSPFAVGLATTRFYRAASFAPFVTKDLDLLRSDAEQCEQIARGLAAGDAHEELLRRENMFPMLETCSRIWGFLKDHDRAAAMMEEIVAEVDPLDSKAWIQVGEMREKRGQLESAYEAFCQAGRLRVPLGAVAWFRAARCAEQLGREDECLECLLRSLRHCAGGTSALLGVLELARRRHDSYLVNWSRLALEGLSERPELVEPERGWVEQALAAQ